MPARFATPMKVWNMRRLIQLASSMRIITWVRMFSYTRGGPK